MYDGKTGNFVGQMNDSEGRIHKGGVYGVSIALNCTIFWYI